MKKIILVLCLFTVQAQSIELVGGNKIIDRGSDKFETTLSKKFIGARPLMVDQIELVGNPNFKPGTGMDLAPVVGFVTSFSKSYPELVTSDVDRLRQSFSEIREIVLDDCKLGFLGVNGSVVYGLATWGKGRGVTIVMPYNNEMESAVRETLENIVLQPDACAWD